MAGTVARPRSPSLRQPTPLLAEFVERVRWSALCEQPMRYAERRYAELWAELTDHDSHAREDAAA